MNRLILQLLLITAITPALHAASEKFDGDYQGNAVAQKPAQAWNRETVIAQLSAHPVMAGTSDDHIEAVASVVMATPLSALHDALIAAAKAGNIAEVTSLLSAPGIDVNARDENGLTALHHAANYGRTEVVRALLAASADVDAPSANGWTPLMLAAEYGHTEVVSILLAASADVNACNQYGDTALLKAAFWGYTEVVKALLATGCLTLETVNALDFYSKTALDIARARGHQEIATLIENYIAGLTSLGAL